MFSSMYLYIWCRSKESTTLKGNEKSSKEDEDNQPFVNSITHPYCTDWHFFCIYVVGFYRILSEKKGQRRKRRRKWIWNEKMWTIFLKKECFLVFFINDQRANQYFDVYTTKNDNGRKLNRKEKKNAYFFFLHTRLKRLEPSELSKFNERGQLSFFFSVSFFLSFSHDR